MRAGFRAPITLLLALGLVLGGTLSCRPGDHPPEAPASKVANWLVDKLYVEVRQAQAIEATAGAARERIAAEQKAVAGVRDPRGALASRAAQVYWERTAEREDGPGSWHFTYLLTFTASGLRIDKEVVLGLQEGPPGIWKVHTLSERDRKPPSSDP